MVRRECCRMHLRTTIVYTMLTGLSELSVSEMRGSEGHAMCFI